MQLEVVVTDAGDARAAQQGGATRVELVRDLESGGLTPDDHVIASVAESITIPLHVILRPHDNGFVYSARQQEHLVQQASRMRALGATALVFGALDETGHVAVDVVDEVASSAQLSLTFHRAFDAVHTLSAAYAVLAGIPQVERVLTAGGAPSAWEGRERLRELSYGNTAPTVVAAGGILAENVSDLIAFSRVREVHVGRGARSNGRVDSRKVAHLVELLLKGT
jgi:copper homeostasis protein